MMHKSYQCFMFFASVTVISLAWHQTTLWACLAALAIGAIHTALFISSITYKDD